MEHTWYFDSKKTDKVLDSSLQAIVLVGAIILPSHQHPLRSFRVGVGEDWLTDSQAEILGCDYRNLYLCQLYQPFGCLYQTTTSELIMYAAVDKPRFGYCW